MWQWPGSSDRSHLGPMILFLSDQARGADLSIAVVIDAAPDEPVRVTMQRGRGAAPERGARVSLHCEADDVVLIEP